MIKCQHRRRLNEQGNEGNEWESFTLKSLINLATHQPLSVVHLCPCIAALLRVDHPGQFIHWPRVPGAINSDSCPRALSFCLCPLSQCFPHFHKHSTSLDLRSLSFSSPSTALSPLTPLFIYPPPPLSPRSSHSVAKTPATTRGEHFPAVSSLSQLTMHRYPLLSWWSCQIWDEAEVVIHKHLRALTHIHEDPPRPPLFSVPVVHLGQTNLLSSFRYWPRPLATFWQL